MTTTAKRPSAARKHTRTTEAKNDLALDQGIALVDDDGTRLVVRIRDVKGIHDAKLVQTVGCDFMGLLERLNGRQGLDLFGAALWFARLVNGRETESYEDILNRFGWEDFEALGFDVPDTEDESPKAPGSSS